MARHLRRAETHGASPVTPTERSPCAAPSPSWPSPPSSCRWRPVPATPAGRPTPRRRPARRRRRPTSRCGAWGSPEADAPTELGVETLIKGDGATVQAGDTVTVQYQGVIWNTGEIFDESWSRGAPATFSTDQVITGFADGMVGQTVGSQTVVVIPPADGYGEAGAPQAGISGTDTLVFVIDILAVS
jgi:hypothetical protein